MVFDPGFNELLKPFLDLNRKSSQERKVNGK